MSAPPRSRVFLVTGAASGIGAAAVDALAARGERALATDVRLDALEARARAGGWTAERVRLRKLDVASEGDWAGAFDDATAAFGRVDVLLNVAGYLKPGNVRDAAVEEIVRHLDVNVKGVILGTRAAARRMAAQGEGHVINVASIAALWPAPGIAAYTASKYAVRGFSLAAAQELAPLGIAVTVVCPDAVSTPMLDSQAGVPEAAATFSAPRVLRAEEVASALLGPVLDRRPLEHDVPGRARFWIARLSALFPWLVRAIGPLAQRQGLKRQARLRAGAGA